MFVGTTALGTREVVSTPLDTLFTGVEVQATVADNLLQQDFIRRPEHGVTVETQIVARRSASSRRCWSGDSASPGARSARCRRAGGRVGGARLAAVDAAAPSCRRSFRRSG